MIKNFNLNYKLFTFIFKNYLFINLCQTQAARSKKM